MTWLLLALRLALSKLAALVSSRRLDDDFDEELASHLAFAEEEARRRGLDANAARRAAMRQLGGVARARELHRDTRGVPVIDSLRQDLAYALRTLRKTPVFTFVIIASLALGIGANTAVFTLLNAVLLRALPVPRPEQLVRLTAAPVLSYAMYQDLRERQQVLYGHDGEFPRMAGAADARFIIGVWSVHDRQRTDGLRQRELFSGARPVAADRPVLHRR